jgi:integrase/recombinase XerD
MGQFRDRMDEDLRMRGHSASTRECYVRCVRNFVRHFMRPPDQLTLEHIRQYQLHLTRERHVAWTYFNQVVCALRFFYREVLKTDWEVRHIPYQKTGCGIGSCGVPGPSLADYVAGPGPRGAAIAAGGC